MPWIELPQADEALDRRMVTNQDEAQIEASVAEGRGEEIEDLEHLELVVEIVLEPQHDLTAVPCENLASPGEIVEGLLPIPEPSTASLFLLGLHFTSPHTC